MLTERVAAYLAREHLLSPDQKVVVGVSGGPDSLCLLDVLTGLGFPTLVAHFDHRWRSGSWRDAQFVLRTARRLGLPAVVERAERGEATPGADEEAARISRYRFLVREARRWGASAIATGHTADDQAETILMHLLRGTGVHGLRGMTPRTDLRTWGALGNPNDLSLVRPLLGTTRAETEAYCRERGFRPRRDPTNLDRSFFRNRLRHELLPTLARYNPRIRDILVRTGEVMRQEVEMVEAMVEAAAPAVLDSNAAGTVRIDRNAFLSQPGPVQAGLLVRGARLLAPDLRDFGFEAVALARARLESTRRGRRTPLSNGLELVESGAWSLLVRLGESPALQEYPLLPRKSPAHLVAGAPVLLHGGWRLTLSRTPRPVAPPTVRGVNGLTREAWVNRDRVDRDLVVRGPRPGDRMQPLGMVGHRKLSEIFNTAKIPAEARSRWPVVVCGEAVVWLCGLRVDDAFRLTPEATSALVLRLEDPEEARG